jgi:hypothetical protein
VQSANPTWLGNFGAPELDVMLQQSGITAEMKTVSVDDDHVKLGPLPCLDVACEDLQIVHRKSHHHLDLLPILRLILVTLREFNEELFQL